MKIKTEKELGEALKNDQDRIEIEGDLSRKVIKIKATKLHGRLPLVPSP